MPQAPTHYPVRVERHRAGSSESAGGRPAGARPARSTGTHPCGRLMEAHDDHEVGFVLIHGSELGPGCGAGWCRCCVGRRWPWTCQGGGPDRPTGGRCRWRTRSTR
jgi:hypothetical protein